MKKDSLLNYIAHIVFMIGEKSILALIILLAFPR